MSCTISSMEFVKRGARRLQTGPKSDDLRNHVDFAILRTGILRPNLSLKKRVMLHVQKDICFYMKVGFDWRLRGRRGPSHENKGKRLVSLKRS